MLEFQFHCVNYKTWHFRLLLMALQWVPALLAFSRSAFMTVTELVFGRKSTSFGKSFAGVLNWGPMWDGFTRWQLAVTLLWNACEVYQHVSVAWQA